MALKNVLFLHGYSETSLGAYYNFPQRLQTRIPALESIVVSAFESLDDTVTIDDLAAALEDKVQSLEKNRGWKMNETAVICHSTGALVARRWIVTRALKDGEAAKLPSHFITMAGANHGSSLAQIGRSAVGYLQKFLLKHGATVGARVLIDLDYGSHFLVRLNSQWLELMGKPPLSSTFLFSMGGATTGGDRLMQLFWPTKEPGSDNTVRISGANLNYTILEADPAANPPVFTIMSSAEAVPHLVLPDYSHYGPATGIWGFNRDPDEAIDAAVEALKVADAGDYTDVLTSWTAKTNAWAKKADRAHVNSTVVFKVTERSGAPVDDCLIIFLDKKMAANDRIAAQASASDAAVPGTPFPIQNNADLASYSFYLNYDQYMKSSPHMIHIEAHNPSPLINYNVVDYDTPAPNDPSVHLIRPNEFTYVKVALARDTDAAYAMYQWGPHLDLSNWLPFPPGGLIP
ncbi:MAG TPA: hypothetical protein VGC72_07660 [Candidatus Elarobacter sp.]|jgi:hypothetical protein